MEFFSKKIPLTSADCFILALEKHDKHIDTSGNTCRYIIDLDGVLSLTSLKQDLEKNKIINWLSKFYISENLTIKKWSFKEDSIITINEVETDEDLPKTVLDRKIDKSTPPLLYFDILKRKNNQTRLILSWHHLLMDGYGAVLLLKFLGNVLGDVKSQNTVPFKRSLRRAIKAKKFLTNTSKGKISDIFNPLSIKGEQQIKILNFSLSQSDKIRSNALSAGAKFGISPFYLSCVSISLKNTLELRNKEDANFWVPVPQDNRKKGAKSPVIGNHLSFLFYRLYKDDLSSIRKAVDSINQQMVYQIKEDLPKAYNHLIGMMKRIPSSVYYQFIKGPKGKSLSSFLFTVAANHPKELKKLFGLKIINAISLPPNTYPPGITFAFTSFEEKIQVAILYYDSVISKEEMNTLENDIKHHLIG